MAVGDIWEWYLDDYWTFTSTPASGYESELWSSWEDVIDSKRDVNGNDDMEIVFNTWSDSSYMGVLELKSKMIIEDSTELIFRGRFGVRYTYGQVRTCGYVQICDITTQTTICNKAIQSSGSAGSWYWDTFYEELNLDYNHQYVIKLIGCDSWIQQKVEVAWESAEVWFNAPYYRTLSHQGYHSWRHVPKKWWIEHIYECKFYSNFRFGDGQIDDNLRDHRPYVIAGGNPYGWDPCYLHEFRSVPYQALEGDEWYATNLPGSTGYSDSSEFEEQYVDGYEEIEVYTLNPELLVAGTLYNVWVRYQVWRTGSVTVTLEGELGNEDDYLAPVSPPAYPVAYLDGPDKIVSHSEASWLELYSYSSLLSNQNTSTPLINDLDRITYLEQNQWFDVALSGYNREFLRIFTRLNIESKADLDAFVSYKDASLNAEVKSLQKGEIVPATITFDGLASADEIISLVKKYNLEVLRFRFTAQKNGDIIRGQGTPDGENVIPIEELQEFIVDYEILGFQSVDINLKSENIIPLSKEEIVFVADISAFFAVLNAGISLFEFEEVCWNVEDASWYLNYAYSS